MSSSFSRGVVVALFLAGCAYDRHDERDSFDHRAERPDTRESTPTPPSAPAEEIDPKKELLITHRSVLLDRRAIDGVWSFSHFVPNTSAWLSSFGTTTHVGPSRAAVTPRPKPAYHFRLIAIVNRFDIGELRFVYTAVDPATDKAAPMTVIVESRVDRCTAAAWHALARVPYGDGFNADLEVLTKDASLARVRTNESIGDDGWEMREFDRALAPAPLAMTPRNELDRSPSLESWIEENDAAIERGAFTLPSGFQAGASLVPERSFRWNASESFNKATCNGCHGVAGALPFQHLAASDQPIEYYPSRDDGETRVSQWLQQELTHREELLREALAKGCY
jgi:hypothetical protein